MNREELKNQIRALSAGTIASLIGDTHYKAVDAAQQEWLLAADKLTDDELKSFDSWCDFIDTIIKSEKHVKEEEITMKDFAFTTETMTAKGKTYPVEYSVGSLAVTVFVKVSETEDAVKVRFDKNHPCYADALAAAEEAAAAWKARRNAEKHDESPAANVAAEQIETESEKPEAPAQVEEERTEIISAPAPVEFAPVDPSARADAETLAEGKAPRGNVPEKTFIGQTIAGNGWRILFDAETSRTRIVFDKKPSDDVKTILDAAGFYYSTGMDSWNKKLTFKAYRAAQAISEKLAALCA